MKGKSTVSILANVKSKVNVVPTTQCIAQLLTSVKMNVTAVQKVRQPVIV